MAECRSENVAVVHCMVSFSRLHVRGIADCCGQAGLGRTGTVICSYMLYSGIARRQQPHCASSDRRCRDARGVRMPSQIRYIYSFLMFLQFIRDRI